MARHVGARLADHLRRLVLPAESVGARLGPFPRARASDAGATRRPRHNRHGCGDMEVHRRSWVRWMAFAAVVGVVLQGVLGGVRVVADARWIARVHGLTAAAVLYTLRGPGDGDFARSGWRNVRRWSMQPAGVCVAWHGRLPRDFTLKSSSARSCGSLVRRGWQLVSVCRLGEGSPGRIDRGRHDLAGDRSASQRRQRPPLLAARTRLLASLFLLQVVLAGGTWVTHYGWPAWFTGIFGTMHYTVVENGPWQIRADDTARGRRLARAGRGRGRRAWSARLLPDSPP